MLELIRHAPATDAGPLDLGFRPEAFADDPPVNPTSGSDADAPLYGPTDKRAFEAFIRSEDGHRATAQMNRCIDTIAQFARDRGAETTAKDIAHLNTVLKDGASMAVQSHYLPDLHAWGKRALEQIVAELARLEARGPRHDHDILRRLEDLGEGISQHCGGRILQQLTTAEERLRQLGGGLKASVARVCRNTADAVITQTIADSGADVILYTSNAHVQPQLAFRVGLPWARVPMRDPFFSEPRDFQQRIEECRLAVRQSVTPAAVARALADECMHKARTRLHRWAGETPDLDGGDWPTLDAVVRKLGGKYDELEARRFVRGDGVQAPTTMTNDPLAVLSNIRSNLVKAGLVQEKDDVTLWEDSAGDTPWKLVLMHGDHPAVVEEDMSERSVLPADWLFVLRKLASSGALEAPSTGPLSDPTIRRQLIAGAIAAQTAPPSRWDVALLAVPGVLSQVCASLEDEAAARLLAAIAARADAAGTALPGIVLEAALQGKLPAAAKGLTGAMALADLRAVWPRVLPHLSEALLAANDILADAVLVALDRLCAPTDGLGWTPCRQALHEFRRAMRAWFKSPSTLPLPPWPDHALRALGKWNREGLLPGSTIVTLLQGDMRLGAFFHDIGKLADSTYLRHFLAGLAQAGDALALSPEDMRSLLRPIRRIPRIHADREVTSPLCIAVLQGQDHQVREFLSWLNVHATASWMPEIRALVLPDEVNVPEVGAPQRVSAALKAYLDGLLTLHENGHLDARALAPLIEVAPDDSLNALPTGQGVKLVRLAMGLTDAMELTDEMGLSDVMGLGLGLGEAVLREWRTGAAQRLSIDPSLVEQAVPDSTRRPSPSGDAAPADRPAQEPGQGSGGNTEPVLPRMWRLPPAQLEEALVHFGRQGYFSVPELIDMLGANLRPPPDVKEPFGKERGLRVIQQLSSDGVLSRDDCVAMLSDPA